MQVIIFLAMAIFFSAVSVIRHRRKRSSAFIVETGLLYLLVFCVGLSGLFAFAGHAFFADRVAASIGWPAGSPFQREVAAANLAFGVLGILCLFIRGHFWIATGIGYAIFLFGAAFIHIRDIITVGNYAINNAGPILYIGDILIPLSILVLLAIRKKLAAR